MKKYIPNILTVARIIVTPIIILLGLTEHVWLLIILAIIIALTDTLDGYLARKWNVVSTFGAKADVLADKILAIGLLILLIFGNNNSFS